MIENLINEVKVGGMSKQAEKLAKTTTFEIDPDAQPYKPGFWAVDYDPTQAQWTDTESELGGFNVDVQGPPDVEAVMPDIRARDLHTPPGPPGEADWRMRQQVPSILKQSPKYDKDVPPLVVSGLSDATDTSVEVKSGEMSNWVVNAEKALQDMIKTEETDPTSRIQSAGQKPVVPEPAPLSIGDEGVQSMSSRARLIEAAKEGTYKSPIDPSKTIVLDNIMAVGMYGSLPPKRYGKKGVDLIEGALMTNLRVPSPNTEGYDTPGWLDYGGLRMSGPEFMDASVDQDYEEGGVKKTRTVPTTKGIMPHGITDANKSINYMGLYRGSGRKGAVGRDIMFLSERAQHGGLVGSDNPADQLMHPGDTEYHEPMHRMFAYLWNNKDYKLIKDIKVQNAQGVEVELVDLIFPKSGPNKSGRRTWNSEAMHDIIYSASKYPEMWERVGHPKFGEATTLSDEDNINRNVAIIKKINDALKDEAQKILRSKGISPPLPGRVPHNA